jgi:hypothetical protein
MSRKLTKTHGKVELVQRNYKRNSDGEAFHDACWHELGVGIESENEGEDADDAG